MPPQCSYAVRSSQMRRWESRRFNNLAAQCFPFLFLVGITAPAHLRRCASAQPVANEAERPETHACAPSRQVAHTLHPFATGCIGKCFARRRQVQPGVIPPRERTSTKKPARATACEPPAERRGMSPAALLDAMPTDAPPLERAIRSKRVLRSPSDYLAASQQPHAGAALRSWLRRE